MRTPELTRGNPSHGRLQPRGEVGSRRGEVGLAVSALPASPSSQKGASGWEGWFTSLALTEEHQRFTDTWPTS
eukprot:1196082-Prorocentrum_minimum.AAC.1